MVDFLFCRFGFDNFLLREMIAEVTQFVNSEFEYKQVCFILYNLEKLLGKTNVYI